MGLDRLRSFKFIKATASKHQRAGKLDLIGNFRREGRLHRLI